MMNNNWQRLNIWMGLKNRFDYVEFSEACQSSGIEPQSILEFAQKAGMVSCAMVSYPDVAPSEAYLTLISLTQNEPLPVPRQERQFEVKPCGGCGGGKVR